ncbi:Imm21 family immunity protein [Microtetraspora malaysiensis]|uniref:Imm21 family immunity protein n=1 Tax=Microtetraspora malaysiensis TaxID=161358 RepID=UPI003D9172A5
MLHTWVETAGGPLIVVPKSELDHWAGVDHNDGPVETWGDYGRACAAEGYIGLVTVGAQQALVLGDEPAMTTGHVPLSGVTPADRPWRTPLRLETLRWNGVGLCGRSGAFLGHMASENAGKRHSRTKV